MKERRKASSKPKANHEASKRKSKAGRGGVGQWGGWKDEERIPPPLQEIQHEQCKRGTI